MEAFVAEFFNIAQSKWPALTWEQFREVGMSITNSQPNTSIEELSVRLEEELTRKFGAPAW